MPERRCGCHKGQTFFLLAMIGIAVAGSYLWREKRVGPSASPVSENTVSVYYFHGTIRCQKCQEIERITREAVESFYAEELSDGRFRWQSVDFDLPANRHYLDDFNLQLPSLAVECRKGGSVRRTVLTNTWEKVAVPEDLEDYILTGIEAFRAGAEPPVMRPVTP